MGAPFSCRRVARAALLSVVFGWIHANAAAAGPELKHIHPVAGMRGSNVLVSIGKTDAWPKIWCSAAGVKFSPTPQFGTYNVEIPADAPVGSHLIRTWNAEGASAPRFFIITEQREIISVEPNDDPKSGQGIEALPASISGRLDKNGDVDGYAVRLNKGQTLVARLEGYVLASTFDGLLRISDEGGRVLGFNHDDGRTLDPLLAWTAPHDGKFVVQVMGFAHPAQANVQLTGGEGCVYRLHLEIGPVVRTSLPMSVQAGTKTHVRLIGWNLPSETVEVDASQLAAGASVPVLATAKALHPIAVSPHAENTEPEPDVVGKGHPLEIPSAISGTIGQGGDDDRYTFKAAKDRIYELRVTAAKAGSPLDARLRIEDAAGKEVGKNDDAGGRDPRIDWKAPADGEFTAVINNLTRKGGRDHVYRLAISEATPSASGKVSSHSLEVTAGKTAEMKVTVKRTGVFQPKLQLIAQHLPAGVTAEALPVPDKDGELTVKLTADAAASPGGQPFRIALKEIEGGKEYPVRYSIASTSEDNGVPQGYTDLVVDSTDQLWLTVLPAAAK